MKIFCFLSIFFLTGFSFSQSKKEQIEQLTNRVDSLNQVLSSERSTSSQKVSEFNATISNLESKISSLNATISNLNLELQTSKADASSKQAELNSKQQEITNLQAQVKQKTDSLALVLAELEKLKPAPKPLVTNTTNQVTQTGSYKSVKIGSQTWMSENLDVDKFRNGDPIPEAKTDEEWEQAGKNKMPSWCYYDNDPKNALKYGKLYNWYAVNDVRGLAPEGWHIPSEYEFHKLFDNDSIGKSFDQLKSEEYWQPCTLIDEHYYQIEKNGFNAFPSKKRYSDGTFIDYESANFWTTTFWNTIDIYSQSCPIGIFFFDYNHFFSEISVVNCSNFEDGLSVRCLRD
jgi:uncharacterized protein (TIGR02145 family)